MDYTEHQLYQFYDAGLQIQAIKELRRISDVSLVHAKKAFESRTVGAALKINKEFLARRRLEESAADLLSAAKHCLVPLAWARDNMDQMFAPKVQRNIDAINAAVSKAEGK